MSDGTCQMLVIRPEQGRERIVECEAPASWEVRHNGLLLCHDHLLTTSVPPDFVLRYPRPWWRFW